ncbi:uncharacterized protein LOC108160779 [Drosophila miranda]|uniref:uncharacterized protein LOC108160779 n=1 Tax=Drosophila miranda TaxID=7229 RepID=UPI00143F47DA|nr:uncharacterized protein LOC108160779 [Drosophila miranda]
MQGCNVLKVVDRAQHFVHPQMYDVPLSEEQLQNAIEHVPRESRSAELNSGEVNMLYNLQLFTSPDEFHMDWGWHRKWNVLVIAAFNMDGSNFHYLHMKLSMVRDKVMGNIEINEALMTVLNVIHRRGYSNRLFSRYRRLKC